MTSQEAPPIGASLGGRGYLLTAGTQLPERRYSVDGIVVPAGCTSQKMRLTLYVQPLASGMRITRKPQYQGSDIAKCFAVREIIHLPLLCIEFDILSPL